MERDEEYIEGLVRRDTPVRVREEEGGHHHCPVCGNDITVTVTCGPGCGKTALILIQWAFCHFCGQRLEWKAGD